MGLRWTETKKALKNYKVQMTSIFDIFSVIDLEKEPEPKNIFIEGKNGHSRQNLHVETLLNEWNSPNNSKVFFCTWPCMCVSISAAEPGMGKTSSLALVALKWVKGEGIISFYILNPISYLFLSSL